MRLESEVVDEEGQDKIRGEFDSSTHIGSLGCRISTLLIGFNIPARVPGDVNSLPGWLVETWKKQWPILNKVERQMVEERMKRLREVDMPEWIDFSLDDYVPQEGPTDVPFNKALKTRADERNTRVPQQFSDDSVGYF